MKIVCSYFLYELYDLLTYIGLFQFLFNHRPFGQYSIFSYKNMEFINPIVLMKEITQMCLEASKQFNLVIFKIRYVSYIR